MPAERKVMFTEEMLADLESIRKIAYRVKRQFLKHRGIDQIGDPEKLEDALVSDMVWNLVSESGALTAIQQKLDEDFEREKVAELRAAVEIKGWPAVDGDWIEIELKGRCYAGVIKTIHDYGQEGDPNWYVEFGNEDVPQSRGAVQEAGVTRPVYGYWKQKPDGGTCRFFRERPPTKVCNTCWEAGTVGLDVCQECVDKATRSEEVTVAEGDDE